MYQECIVQYDKYYHYCTLYMKAVKRANPEVSHQKKFFFFFYLWDHRCSFNFLWSFMTYVSHITMSHTLFRAVHQFHTNTTRRKKCQRAHPDFMEPKTYTESLFNKYNTKKLICKLPKKICYHVSPLLGSLPGP